MLRAEPKRLVCVKIYIFFFEFDKPKTVQITFDKKPFNI